MAPNLATGALLLGGGLMAGGAAVSWAIIWIQLHTSLVTVRGNNNELLRISKFTAQSSAISAAGHAYDWQLKLEHVNMRPAGLLARAVGLTQWGTTVDTAVLRHDAARNALATILPHTNQAGGGKRAVKDALEVLGDAPGVPYLLHLAANTTSWRQPKDKRGEIMLGLLPSSLRLALEMSLHENDERRAMEGELKELEQRWRDADAIAKIADEMFLPEHIEEHMRALRETKPDDS